MSTRRIISTAIALLALALGLNAIVTERETRPAEADIGRVLELPGGDLQVRDRGPRRAPAVLLVHCYTCSMHYWRRVEPLLADDRRVISVDLLGHGGSEKPRDGYSIEHQADTIAQALRRLDAPPVLAVGQSLGGPIATALAERHRRLVRGIVVMDSPPSTDFLGLPLTARVARAPVIGSALRRLAPDAAVRRELSKAFADGFEVPDQFVADVRRMTFASFRGSSGEDYIEQRPLDDRLAATALPVLVVFGGEDRIVDPKAADDYRDVPGARVVVLPGVGHTPQVERPRRSAELIRALDRSALR